MTAAVAQFVFRPNPGTDMTELVGLIKEAASMWRGHGAQDVSLWGVQVGEIGNLLRRSLRVHREARGYHGWHQ